MTPTRWPADPPREPLPAGQAANASAYKALRERAGVEPGGGSVGEPWPHPPMITAIGRGLLGRCPACGKAHLFNGFLRVVTRCSNCEAPLGSARADDAPPYITILITGHIIVPLLYLVDRMNEPPLWVMSAIFLPLTLFVSLGLLRPVKGGTVGIMLTLHMLKTDSDQG